MQRSEGFPIDFLSNSAHRALSSNKSMQVAQNWLTPSKPEAQLFGAGLSKSSQVLGKPKQVNQNELMTSKPAAEAIGSWASKC